MLALLLVSILGCGSGADGAVGEAAPPPPAVPVEVARVQGGGLSSEWTVSGDVRALERADLAAGAEGAITRVTAREGDTVAPGELLVEVDADIARAEVRAARASRQAAQARRDRAAATLGRVRKVERGVLAVDEVDAAEAELAVREAELAQAAAALSLAEARRARHQVVAPFPGTVGRRLVDVGDWVSPGVPVLQLIRIDGVEVVVDAPPDLARAVSVGDAVQIADRPGAVVGVVPALDAATRTARVRVVPEEPGELVPGAPVEVTFAVERSGGLVVPRDAVVETADELRVFRVVEGTARPVRVDVLASGGAELLVEADGLAVGDVLVVRGNERLRPEQPVTVTE